MRSKLLIYIILALLPPSVFELFALNSEPAAIAGRICDGITKEPLVGANVTVENTSWGAATGPSGTFSIKNIPHGKYRIKVSYMGYESKFIDIETNADPVFLTFELQECFFLTEHVVVTAARTRKLMENVPVVTELITKKEIEQIGAQDLADVLDNHLGIFIERTEAGGQYIKMGGADGKSILVLIDGMPFTGKFDDRQELNQINANIIDHIEIVKGPSSAIYGSEAMSGVINIITKKIGREFGINVKGKTGSHDLYNGNIYVNKSFDSLGVALNMDHIQGGIDPTITSLKVRNSQATVVGGKITYNSSASGIYELGINWYDGNQYGDDERFHYNTDITQQDGRFRWNKKFGKKLLFQIYTFLSENERDYKNIAQRSRNINSQNIGKENLLGLKCESSIYLFTKARLDIGIDYSKNSYHSKRLKIKSDTDPTLITDSELDIEKNPFGIYGQIEFCPVKNLTLIAGNRYDRVPILRKFELNRNDIESHYSPHINALYALTHKFKMRASYGGGFRVPSFNEMFINLDHLVYGYVLEGNPNLVPERSKGSSLGFEYFWNYQILSNITAYQNTFSNKITEYLIKPHYISYTNIDASTFSLEFQSKILFSKTITPEISYSYTSINQEQVEQVVINMPPHSAAIKFDINLARFFEMSLRDRWYSEQTIWEFDSKTGDYYQSTKEAYHQFDATLTIKASSLLNQWMRNNPFNNQTNMFTLRCGANNITDYTDKTYGPWIGRRIFLALDINY